VEIRSRAFQAFRINDPDRRVFGALRFLGGLELSASDADFGGFSSLRMLDEHGRFLSLSDRGTFLAGRLVEQAGRPAGIVEAELAPALDARGRPLALGPDFDTESMAFQGGTLFVGVERSHTILRFDYRARGLAAEGTRIPVPAEMKRWPRNRGIEALGVMPAGSASPGSLLAISERSGSIEAPTEAFLIGGPAPGKLLVARHDQFDITDLAFLPGGDLVLLERRFTWLSGVAMRLRRVALATVRPGAVLDGEVLLGADMGYAIDNMEGLSIDRDPGGRVVFTLISDDNFSLLQRTLLLRFAYEA